MFLNYFALGVLIFVFLVIFYGIIIIHDIPYLIAKKRNHLIPMLFMSPDGSVFLLSTSSGRFYGFGPRCTSLSAAGACSIRRIRPLMNLKKRPIYNSFAND